MLIKPYGVDTSAERVIERLAHGDQSCPPSLIALVRHLHDFVRETKPSSADWREAISFITDIGHATDDKRQEWVLASDLLGVTALLEEINSPRPKGATPNTVRGLFYRPDAPRIRMGANISLDGRGDPLTVSARIVDLDGGPIAGAVIETWQANSEGFYENQQPDLQPEFNLRGILTAGDDGRFNYRTVRPSGYATPADGPVGRLLAGLGCPLRRPAHLHFIIRAEGFETISTQLFDSSDALLTEDALFGVKPELICEFKRTGGQSSLDFTFVMARAKRERRAA